MKNIEFRNIGPATMQWLSIIGIKTMDDLRTIGAKTAYKKIIAAGHPENRNLLYALIGAVEDIDWKIIAQTYNSRGGRT